VTYFIVLSAISIVIACLLLAAVAGWINFIKGENND